MTNRTANNMISKTEGSDLILERVFDAPRKLVFQAFAEAEHLERWWSPKGWTMPVCSLDFRPGGVWHFCMKCTDESQTDYYGMESWGKAVFQEIVESERIVYTDYFSDAEGNVVEAEGMPSAIVTNTFIEQDGKTRLVARSRYASTVALQSVLEMGVLEGTGQTWDKLDDLLAELQRK